MHGPLRAGNPEELRKPVEQSRLAGGIGPDDRGDLGGEAHGHGLGTEAAEAGEGDAFEEHSEPHDWKR